MGIAKGALYVGAGLIGVVVLFGVATPVISVLTAPGRVLTETMGTKNVINNYEMFYDINAGHDRRVADIAGHKTAVASATGDEKNRLNVELIGMQQTCRDLVTRYNAESSKMNKSLFKAADLPSELDINTCN